MKITDLLKPESIAINAQAASKDDAIEQITGLMQASGNVNDLACYREAVRAREVLCTTALGEGIAIPHAKTAAVSAPGLAAMTLPEGVDYDAPDGKPTNLMFLIAAPDTEADVHLQVLSRLSMMLMNPDFCDALRSADSPEAFLSVVDEAEAEKVAKEEAADAAAAERDAAGYDVVAVTACPTGIAHTYMAAEGLEKQAKQMGVKIKVETQGSAGAKNVLSADDIAGAKGVIVAADKNVDLARFDGKPLFSCPVARGINEPEILINTILNGEAPIFHASDEAVQLEASSAEAESFGRKRYKELMDGISNVLPVAIAGGLFTAFASLIAGDANSTVAAFFAALGNMAFGFMCPVLAAFIAGAIADRPGFVPGLVGGTIAALGYSFDNVVMYDAATAEPSSVIGALFAGFLAGAVTLALERVCEKLPASFEGIKPTLVYPVFGTLATAVVMFALNPVLSLVKIVFSMLLLNFNTPMLVVLGLVLGAMMSVDLGGPCNKAAYVLGVCVLDPTLSLGATGQIIMASVMAGVMVPPLAVAASMLLFKNRWTENDRTSALSNIIMGLCFMSEGAIPFAAADRAHVLPGFIAGSAAAGALSAAFGCASPAPHGGAWIFLLVNNGAWWLLATALGALVGCLVISFMKKPMASEKL